MWTAILWPFAVVMFDLLIFAITLYLVRTFTHSHDAEWGMQKSLQELPSSIQAEEPTQVALPPARAAHAEDAEREPVPASREPISVA